ncbi:MAG: hypothetical protein ACRCUX_01490 [Beijerinckiaceae bacterium]
MLKLLVNRIRSPIDSAISAMIGKILVVIPVFVALIYLAGALRTYLADQWGPIIADVAMAGVFMLVAAIAAIATMSRRNGAADVADRSKDSERRASSGPERRETGKDGDTISNTAGAIDGIIANVAAQLPLRPQDRDIAAAVLTAAVPLALPKLLRLAMRNLPAAGIAVAALYVISRSRPAQPQTAVRDQLGTESGRS